MKSSPNEEPPRSSFIGRHFRRIRDKMRYYFKRYGWKVGAAIFVYYLVRDTVLYIILPILIAQKVID